jgi:hypothetical protein
MVSSMSVRVRTWALEATTLISMRGDAHRDVAPHPPKGPAIGGKPTRAEHRQDAKRASCLRELPPGIFRQKSYRKDTADMVDMAECFYLFDCTVNMTLARGVTGMEERRPEAHRRHIRQLSRLFTENSAENSPSEKFPEPCGRCGVLAECFYLFYRTVRQVTSTSRLYTTWCSGTSVPQP